MVPSKVKPAVQLVAGVLVVNVRRVRRDDGCLLFQFGETRNDDESKCFFPLEA